MQLDEQIQQHVVSLPIELKAEVLDFVLYLEEKRERQAKDRLKYLMSVVPASVNLADELIAERRLEAKKEQFVSCSCVLGCYFKKARNENFRLYNNFTIRSK